MILIYKYNIFQEDNKPPNQPWNLEMVAGGGGLPHFLVSSLNENLQYSRFDIDVWC